MGGRNLIKVEGNNSFRKDPSTGALININTKERDEYLKKKMELQKQKQLEADVAELKTDLQEIKNMLRSLIK